VSRYFVLVLLCVALLVTGTAHAQSSPVEGDSRALAQQAKAAFDAGDFPRAAKLLEEAYAAKPWPVYLYNLGRTYQQAGNKPEAVHAYERYLTAEPHSPDAGAVRESVRQLKDEIYRDSLLEQQARADKERAAREALDAQRSKEAMERAQQEASDAAERARHKPSAWPWIVAGVGVSGVAAGVVLGVLSSSAHGAAVSDPTVTQTQSDQSTAQTYATAANVLFVSGAVVGVVGTVWGVFDLRLAFATRARVSFLPGSVVFGGAF
jgi:tetratricopeptide (TPR) repeat protein